MRSNDRPASGLEGWFKSLAPIRQEPRHCIFQALGVRQVRFGLAVTDKGWLLVSEIEDGGAHVEKSDFGDTLFLDLASILLLGPI
jgi:hypothetical protein